MTSTSASRFALLGLAAFLAATSVGGCGSSGHHASTGPARSVVVTDPGAVVSIVVAVGDTVDFRLPPLTGEHRVNGQPVSWPAPYTSRSPVLAALAGADCPPDYTCETFKALVSGSAVVSAPSPSGIICGGGHGCAGITARLPFQIPLQVRAQGAPVVSYRS